MAFSTTQISQLHFLDTAFGVGKRLAVFAVSFAAAIALGLTCAYASGQVRLVFASAAAALIPALIALAALSPATSGAVLSFSQIFDAYEFDARVFTVSIGMVALGSFLLIRVQGNGLNVIRIGGMGMVAGAMALYVSTRLLQLLHVDPGLALRGLVTAAGFAAFWLAGALAGTQATSRKGLAIGAAAALLILAVIAILVSEGLFPAPPRINPARDFFGFTSPFRRNYGLDVGYSAAAFLVALSAPWLYWQLMRPGGQGRVAAGACLLLMLITNILVFQSRSMLVEVVAAFLLAVVLTRRSAMLGVVTAGAVGLSLLYVVPSLLSADRISSDIRGDSYSTSIEILKSKPAIFLIGSPRKATINRVQLESTYGELVPDAPVHNVFLMETLVGGLGASGALAALLLIPAWRGFKLSKQEGEAFARGFLILLTALILVIEMSINPAEANVAGLWLSLGIMATLSCRGLPADPSAEISPVKSPRRLILGGRRA